MSEMKWQEITDTTRPIYKDKFLLMSRDLQFWLAHAGLGCDNEIHVQEYSSSPTNIKDEYFTHIMYIDYPERMVNDGNKD